MKDDLYDHEGIVVEYARVPLVAECDLAFLTQVDAVLRVVKSALTPFPPPKPMVVDDGRSGAKASPAAKLAEPAHLQMPPPMKPLVIGVSQPQHVFFPALAGVLLGLRTQNDELIRVKREKEDEEARKAMMASRREALAAAATPSILGDSHGDPDRRTSLLSARQEVAGTSYNTAPSVVSERRSRAARSEAAPSEIGTMKAVETVLDHQSQASETLSADEVLSEDPRQRLSAKDLPAVQQLAEILPEINPSVAFFDHGLMLSTPCAVTLLENALDALKPIPEWDHMSPLARREHICNAVMRSEEVCLLLLYHYHLSLACEIDTGLLYAAGSGENEVDLPSFGTFLAGAQPEVLNWWRTMDPWREVGEPSGLFYCPDPYHVRYTNSFLRRRIYQRLPTAFL